MISNKQEKLNKIEIKNEKIINHDKKEKKKERIRVEHNG